MKAQDLVNKKITLATLKSFIRKAEELFVIHHSSFCGMSDMVETNENPTLIKVSKEDAIGIKGVWVVGGSRDYFWFKETETMYGIRVSNACGHATLWTNK